MQANHLLNRTNKSMMSVNTARTSTLNPRTSTLDASPAYNFAQEKAIDAALEQSIIEFLEGVFDNVQISAFKRLYDGDLQLQVLNQMEPDYWKPTSSSGEKKRASQVFTPSSKKNDKRATAPLISRAEKLKNFKYLAQCADKYFNDLNESSIIPPNFASSQINQLIDLHSQKPLLVTIDLILIVMLNNENSETYIQKIMTLSE